MKSNAMRIGSIQSTLLALLLLLCALGAQAKPEYAMKEKVDCLHCHERPGEARNFRGLYYAAHSHTFEGFDEIFEAKRAGVKPDAKGLDARPTVKGYPDMTAAVAAALNFTMKSIDGQMVHLGRYQGDVVLVVNVASFCGNTPQYAALQKLYDRYKARGFTILAFPSNDFGAQEPGSDKQIKAFCTSKYDVTFPLFSKSVVKGDGQSPFYKYLTSKQKNPQFGGEVEWNFAKFLMNRKGEIVARYRAEVDPLLSRITSQIERELLAPKPGPSTSGGNNE
jgi:glutathione peroxidase